MTQRLARLRSDLELSPSPLPDRPGLLVRDPYRYSDAAIIIPPLLVRCLGCFDGAHTDLDLRAWLGRLTGSDDVAVPAANLARALSEGGFLDDARFHAVRAARHRDFAEAPLRAAAHAGGGYPDTPAELGQTLGAWISDGDGDGGGDGGAQAAARTSPASPPARAAGSTERDGAGLVAIAAPHVSPIGAPATYGAAYRALGPAYADRTFVILGTSHYGQPGKLGLTRKSFQTPLGLATTDVGLADELARAAADGAELEDYCHGIEHSIEFQVVFLQRLFGPSVRILPILCGAFPEGRPDAIASVARALGALGELHAKHRQRLLWVLGVDLAHVGRRYGDDVDARAHEGTMVDVTARDHDRLARVAAGDAAGFWDLVHQNGGDDDLKWCGAAPLYAFLSAVPGARGRALHYNHWNIDDKSVVSVAALSFTEL